MLIPFGDIVAQFKDITGIIHVGANTCEEQKAYNDGGISDDNILWFEANTDVYNQVKNSNKNIKIYNYAICDKDDQEVELIVTNNFQSSSILELKDHKLYYPDIVETSRMKVTTKTLNTFMDSLEMKYNFINMDIQGAELLALKGANRFLHHADYLYLEVNTAELYQGCAQLDEVDKYVAQFGFRRIAMRMTTEKWGDALYVKDKYNLYTCNGDHDTNGEIRFWNSIKDKVKVVFDVGARDTTLPKDSPLDQQFHLFEPNQAFFHKLMSTLTQPNITINNVGLGDKSGFIKYYPEVESPYKRYSKSDDHFIIPITTLDSYCEQNKITHIDFLKIDTEGYEYNVIKGAANTDIDMIQFEYGGTYTDANIKLAQVYDLLKNYKYIYLLTPTGLLPQPKPIEHLQYSNYVASKKCLIK
jgi:FkbM family methyltransferase